MSSLIYLLLRCAAGKPISGVSLVPVYVYGAAGSRSDLVGQSCTLFGREVAGDYKGLFNPFGEKTEPGKTPAQTLLEEIREEMCLDMIESQIMSCLLGIHSIAFGSGVSLVVFVHIIGLQTRLWTDVMKKRVGRSHKWREMDEVKHVCILSAKGDIDLSKYARRVLDLLIEKDILSKLVRVKPLSAASIRTKF